MPKRKKHPRLPNGFGNIRFIGKQRKNPYAVHPPATETDNHGNYLRPKALCYVDDWYIGFAVLNAYHAGTYKPGDELKFKQYRSLDDYAMDELCKRLLSDFSAHAYIENEQQKNEKTFTEVYELFYEWKYGENAKKVLSKQSRGSTTAAYKNCASLHKKIFRNLRYKDLQECINNCSLKSSSINNMVVLIKQMYKYAELYELCDKNYSVGLSTKANDDEHGIPFSDDDLKILWDNQNDPTVEFILIMCYSGFRISAYKSMKVDTDEWYFQGGVKTSAGKDRVVPIHTAIRKLVTRRLKSYGNLLPQTINTFRTEMYTTLERIGIDRHTPHDCRHTFSRLCEKYGVNENDRKRMLGHSFGADITNAIYGHRTVEELRNEIEKIKI